MSIPSSSYRCVLQPYAGPASRSTCPACGTRRRFTRYLDTHTGELLPDPFGRCDREVKCGYFKHPYGKQLPAAPPEIPWSLASGRRHESAQAYHRGITPPDCPAG